MKHYFATRLGVLYLAVFLLMASCNDQPERGADHADDTTGLDTSTAPATAASASAPEAAPRNEEDIQKAYAAVMDQKEKGALDSASFSYNCNDEKNGTVSYFSENGRLRMIVHRYNEYDHYSAADHYFVTDSTLFFVYKKSVSWSFEDGGAGETKDNITEQRIYLADQQPIKCLEKKYTLRSKATNNPVPGSVANKTIDCSSASSVTAPYELLVKHRHKGTSGCLE